MDNKQNLLYPELAFTKAYKENARLSKHLREVACLKVQQQNMLKPIRENQKLCGFIKFYDIGLYHVMYGGVSQGIDKAGYCYDKGNILKKLESGSFSEEERREVLKMCEFWDNEYTNFKARGNFSSEMQKVAPTDFYESESAVVHPLYRVAEMQLDFNKLIKFGIGGLRREIELLTAQTKAYGGDLDFFTGLNEILNLFDDACKFYINDCDTQLKTAGEKRGKELLKIKNCLNNIRISPPESFFEALQLIWLYSVLAKAPDFNRLDSLLGDFYDNDIKNKRITKEEATDLLYGVFRDIQEIYGRNSRVVFGGLGRHNEKNADELALIIMEAGKRNHAPFPQHSLRMYEGMDERLFDKALELLSSGLTLPVLYNDNKNVQDASKAFNVSHEVALEYSFLGCGEYLLSHRSIGTPNVIINMAKVLELTLNAGKCILTNEQIGKDFGSLGNQFATYEELWEAYKKQMQYFVENSAKIQESIYKTLNNEVSFLFQSLLMNDCVLRGKAVLDGGIQHLGGTFETYGNITVSDSLYAIKRAVYEEKKIKPSELLTMLKANFKGYEKELKYLLNLPKYGNGNEEADEVATAVHEHMCILTREQRENTSLDSFLVVEINNSANVTLGKYVGATANGRLAKDCLSNGNNPTKGADKSGITALIHSLTKQRGDIHAGITQNFKFSKDFFDKGRENLKTVIKTFFRMGGSQANINVVNLGDLEDAVKNPNKYLNLLVRVGGYSARFVDLPHDVQRDLIERTTLDA
ncbi:MAG: hypothetical protein FWD49_05110 [Firmicutes bacterium]|nr:hypothetical protein [Bacillota bacterium]